MAKTVFITGCSSGIGLATANLFFAHGWNVVATLRAPEKDTELRALDPARVLVLRLDVQDLPSIEAAVAAALARFGTVDMLVNNAGYGLAGVFEGLAREAIQAQFDVNVFGVMDVTRALLPALRAARGAIVNVSAGMGRRGLPLFAPYCASKFALEGWGEALAHELRAVGVRVRSVVPDGAVGATAFGARVWPALAPDAALAPAYGAFVAETARRFEEGTAVPGMGAGDVAAVVYKAAEDGTERLRYVVSEEMKSAS